MLTISLYKIFSLNVKGGEMMKSKIYLATLLALVFVFQVVPLASAAQIPVTFITIDEYQSVQGQSTFIDVRSQNSRAKSKQTVPGAIWIDPQSGQALQDFIATADKDKAYIIFCSCVDDNYSIRAAQLLTKNGFKDVKVLKNGWDAISTSGFINLKTEV